MKVKVEFKDMENQEEKKYNRFLELCKKSIKLEDIKPGLVCYGGWGFDKKITITSLPYICKYTNSLFVDCTKLYKDGNTTFKSSESLTDNNIVGGGYNLYRLFYNIEDSKEYYDIVDSYTYYGYDGLEYTITPIPGEHINLDDYNFEREK